MISALNMELEIVRTVFRNDKNEVSVYTDTKGESAGNYTVVSIFSKEIAKVIAQRMAISGLFSRNDDFKGYFNHKDALQLVFLYHPESRLCNKEGIYATNFVKRKEIALSFITALAQTEIDGDIGRLLISDETTNIGQDLAVYINYFFDFTKFDLDCSADCLYREAARYAFGILARDYDAKYESQVAYYPNELRLMHKKIENRTFKSYSQIMAFIKSMPDTVKVARTGFMRILNGFESVCAIIRKNPMGLFIATVLVVTLFYLGYQLNLRRLANKGWEENTVYVGMQNIGEIYLGEENI